MKQLYFFFITIFLVNATADAQTKYWVQFSDKNNSPYSLSTPSAYLSSRALARRAMQGIPIDSFDLPVNPAYIAGVAATGAVVHSHSKWLNGVVVFTSNPGQITAINALPYVVSTTGAGFREGSGVSKFADETYNDLDHSMQRNAYVSSTSLNYGSALNQINMLGGVCLHNAGFRGQGMQIAVIDAGFLHADTLSVFDTLWANNRILGTWDFVAGDASVYEDNQHGAMVLSTMGGNLPGQMVGTAPDASYWLLRSEEAATEYLVEEYYWASAAEYADSVGADVINSSLGYNQFDDASENHTYADMNGHTVPCALAANFAARKGMAVVVSAGNSGSSSWFYIGTPADADSALTIAATDASGVVTGFSSRGSLTLFGHQKPSTGAQGQNSTIIDPNTGNVITGNGTSFSSPITCGLVACLWQAHPSLRCMDLLNTIEMSASLYPTPDSLLGYGIPDFCAANLYLGGNPDQLGDSEQLYGVLPNPFTDELNFSFYSLSDQELVVKVMDVDGREVSVNTVTATANAENRYRLNELKNVSSGFYFLQVKSSSATFTLKVVKQ